MYLTRCPNCGEPDAVHPADLGRVVTCSRCPARYPAEVNEADNTREAFISHIQGVIRGLGSGLTSTGVVGITCALIPLVLIGAEDTTQFRDIQGHLEYALLRYAVFGCSLLLSGLVVYGGIQLQRVRHYRLCVLAAVLAMLPFSNLCFPLGWLTGPVALYYLRKPDVRRAFELNRGEE